jgi:hypothetical protein
MENEIRQQNLTKPPIKLSFAVKQGMGILKKNFRNQKLRETAVSILKDAAETEDIEACWRFAACLRYGIGIGKNRDFAISYALIAKEAGSIDGLFWFGISIKPFSEGLPFIMEAEAKGYLLAKWFLAIQTLRGRKGDTENASQIIFEIGTNGGDALLTVELACILENGLLGFPSYPSEADRLREIGKTFSFSDSSFLYYLRMVKNKNLD